MPEIKVVWSASSKARYPAPDFTKYSRQTEYFARLPALPQVCRTMDDLLLVGWLVALCAGSNAFVLCYITDKSDRE
jgi:hypothetical protein